MDKAVYFSFLMGALSIVLVQIAGVAAGGLMGFVLLGISLFLAPHIQAAHDLRDAERDFSAAAEYPKETR